MTKLQLRRTWFSVHKWIGLILAILIIPLCLSGAGLVWDQALDHRLNPQRYATTGSAVLDAPAYVAAARGVLKPGERIASLRVGEEPGDPVVVSAAPAKGGAARGGPPQRTNVYLDPPTAKVLDTAGSNSGFIRFIHNLHGNLLVPGIGRTIVGWIGVAMLFSALTGLWLWWPTVGRWTRGFRWNRNDQLDFNLHHLLGFWIALPLFVLSLTGAWIAFPAFFGMLSGQSAQRGPGGGMGGGDRAAQFRAKPLEHTATSLEAAIAAVRAEIPGSVRAVTWPTDARAEWTITVKPESGPPASFAIDDETGAAEIAPDRGRGQSGIGGLMRRIHDGTGMGIVWQTIIFLGGILPAILAVTGIIMWWRARRWKAELAARQAVREA